MATQNASECSMPDQFVHGCLLVTAQLGEAPNTSSRHASTQTSRAASHLSPECWLAPPVAVALVRPPRLRPPAVRPALLLPLDLAASVPARLTDLASALPAALASCRSSKSLSSSASSSSAAPRRRFLPCASSSCTSAEKGLSGLEPAERQEHAGPRDLTERCLLLPTASFVMLLCTDWIEIKLAWLNAE